MISGTEHIERHKGKTRITGTAGYEKYPAVSAFMGILKKIFFGFLPVR